MELARHIAQMDPFGLRQAKRAVNQTLDVQGFYAAIQSVFDIHQTGPRERAERQRLPDHHPRLEGMKEKIARQ